MIKNKHGYLFIDFIRKDEIQDKHSFPLAGSFAVIKCKGKVLLCFNRFRKQWEIPAGRREKNETPKECAIRELFEETGQRVNNLELKGLMKVLDTKSGNIKYNPIYFSTVEEISPFIENEETTQITLWNFKEKIGDIDEIDLKVLDYV